MILLQLHTFYQKAEMLFRMERFSRPLVITCFALVVFSVHGLPALRSVHNIKPAGQLFWIFVYVGEPPAKHEGYRGSGNSKDIGRAVLNYTNIPGEISVGGDVVSSCHDKRFLKGYVAVLDDQSRFSLSIPDPNRTGKLQVLAVYENGAFTGDGKSRGIESATLVPYSF